MSNFRTDPTSADDGPAISKSTKRLAIGVGVFTASAVTATVGYVMAGWSWVDAIYMVTITVFGVGYGEVQPIEDPGMKLFTILVILTGCSSGIFVLGGLLQMVTEGEVRRIMGVAQCGREIKSLRDHAIICGFGRVGRMLAEQLHHTDQRFVIVDLDPGRIRDAHDEGYLAVIGDATHDDTLRKLGIYSARSMATVLPNDAMNVFITLTARDLCENIQIIARAESPATERKLLRSGASQVVMPAAIGATRIAQLVTREHVDYQELLDATAEEKLRRQLDSLNAAAAAAVRPQGSDEALSPGEEFDEVRSLPVETPSKG
ncbi:MAG: potassium channel family protein [Planctomycetota bacterium]